MARGMLHGFDYAAIAPGPSALLLPAANFVLGLEDGKKRWFDVVLAITKAFSLCGTLDEAIALREEIAFFQAIKSVIAKATTTDKKLARRSARTQCSSRSSTTRWSPRASRISSSSPAWIGRTSDSCPMRFWKRSAIYRSATSPSSCCRNCSMTRSSRAAVPTWSWRRSSATDCLPALNRYRNRAIESAQVIEELIAMAKEFREAAQARREPRTERVRARLLRRVGEQRKRGARAGRRGAEEDRVRADGEAAQQRDRGLAEA